MTKPNKPLLFVSVASYNDPELLPTLEDAHTKAAHPNQLRFGVVDQCVVDRYDALPPWKEQIRYLWMQPRDARGVCFARSIIPGMMEGEEYLLQIDSHMRFDQDWDLILMNQLKAIGDRRALLTASPMPWTPEAGKIPMPKGKAISLEQHPDYPMRNRASFLPNPSGQPLRGKRLAAGCLFAAGNIYDMVPYDPHLYFNGEELLYAQRLMARGWSIYHPAILPIYHLYKQPDGDRSLVHWGNTVERYWDHNTLSRKGEKRIAEAKGNRLGPVFSERPEGLQD
jgi:hypothetical protein